MASVRMSKPLTRKLQAAQPLVEAVLGKKMEFNDFGEMIVKHGLESVLGSIMGAVDAENFMKTMQQLGERDPDTVYGYIAQMLRSGSGVNQEKLKDAKNKLGVHQP